MSTRKTLRHGSSARQSDTAKGGHEMAARDNNTRIVDACSGGALCERVAMK